MKKILIVFLTVLVILFYSSYGKDLVEKIESFVETVIETAHEGTTDNFDTTRERYISFDRLLEAVDGSKLEPVEILPFDSSVGTLPDDIKQKADLISAKYGAVGVQLAVMEGGRLSYTYEYGLSNVEAKTPVSADTKFRVASLSKFVSDMVFMCLCDTGAASVDGDISDYFGYTVRNPYYPDVLITPAMLMAHIGTVIDSSTTLNSIGNLSAQKMQTLLQLRSTFLGVKPGTFYSYSNFSMATVAAMAELISGKHFNELAKEFLFEPLELDTSYLASELKNTDLIATLYGSGGLTVARQMAVAPSAELGQTHHLFQGNLMISAKDYLEILSVICNKGISDKGERIISEESIAEILKPRLTIDYGYGTCIGCEENKVLVKNRTVYVHTGVCYGMVSGFAFDPETGDGIVILTSGTNAVYVDEKGLDNINVEFTDLLFPKK